MRSYRKELSFNINDRVGFVNITPEVEQCLKESGVKEGLLLYRVYAGRGDTSINKGIQLPIYISPDPTES